jgi:type II secretory pathway pseudopilin PulG
MALLAEHKMVRHIGIGKPSYGKHHAGFTYLGVLFFVATMGIMLATAGVIWSTANQRDKERELLFIGNEFRKAIGTYYERTPGTVKRYPATLNDLLKDNRQLATVRHLRRIYPDPFTATMEWGIVPAPDNGIMGIYSLSPRATLKRANFLLRDAPFETAEKYNQWRFIYEPPEKSVEGLLKSSK